MWRPSPLRWISNARAIRNARHACSAMEHRRREREDVDAFLVARRERTEEPLSA